MVTFIIYGGPCLINSLAIGNSLILSLALVINVPILTVYLENTSVLIALVPILQVNYVIIITAIANSLQELEKID